MPATPKTFDAILIGAGQAANPLSRTLSAAGRRVALVERSEIGGSCVNWGCIPTKTMAASARVAYLARRAADFGVHVDGVTVRLDEVRRRKQSVVDESRSGSEKQLEKAQGLTLLPGEASFTGPHNVRVDLRDGGSRELTAPVVVINTGCRPHRPAVPGLDAVPVLDSTSIMELASVPEHLIVLGGGYIALEFGQMFRRFGSRVTIVQRGAQLLTREDRDVADEVANILRDDGIEVLLDATAERAAAPRAGEISLTVKTPAGERTLVGSHLLAAPRAGEISLTVKTPAGERTLVGSHLLAATGRVPNTEELNLSAAGVRTDERGFIPVNDRLETNVPGVYALGDVNGGPAFTHVSHHDNQILRENLLRNAGRTTRGRLVPYTVFIDPQLGRVGVTEREAREKGLSVRVAKMPMAHVGRAVHMGETRGFVKAVVDAGTDQILGCAALSVEGGELMAMLQIAMMGGVAYQRLRDDMFAHPTLAEGLNSLFSRFEGE